MRRTSLTIAALSLVATGGIGLITASRWSAQTAVARFIANHPGLHVGSAEMDALGGTVALHDVSLASGPLRMRAGTVTLRSGGGAGFQLIGQAFAQTPAASGTASAADVTIVNGAITYTIKTIDLTGTSLSNADLAALLDPKGTDTLAARLQKVRADTIAMSDVAGVRKGPDGEVRAAAAQVLLSRVADGKVGAVTAASLTGSLSGGRREATLKTGAAQATGVDLALLERIADTLRTDDAEPLKTLADAVTISDVAVTESTKNTSVTIGTLAQKGLRARPLKTEPSKLDAAGTGDPVTDRAAQRQRTRAFLNDLAGSVEVTAVSLERATLTNADPAGPGRLAVATLAANNYRARHIDGVTVRDFAFEGPTARFGMGSFALADITLPAANPGGTNPSALAIDAYPFIAKTDIGDLAVDIAAPREEGPPSSVRFRVAHVGSTAERKIDGFPSRGDMSVDHLTFDLPDSGSPGASELLAMGYAKVDLSAAVATSYDHGQQTLAVEKLLVSGVDMGAVTLAVDFANVSPSVLSANAAVARASMFAMLLKRIDLRLVDGGLVDKALALKAKQDGKSLAEERDGVADLLATSLPQALGNGPGIKAIGAAAAAFVAAPKNLHVSLASKDGLGASDLGRISTPDDLLSRLDIQAEANR